MIDLDVTKERIEECDRRIAQINDAINRALDAMDCLESQRAELRREVRSLLRQLKEAPDNAVLKARLNRFQLHRKAVRRLYLSWVRTVTENEKLLAKSENTRRNAFRDLIEWGS